MPDPVILSNDERQVLEALSTRPGHFSIPRTERELHTQRSLLNALQTRGFVKCVGGDRWQITEDGGRWLAANPPKKGI
jgi:hypothetical protein